MRVLITGATGFVGRHVVSLLLASGHSVVALARDEGMARNLPWFEEVEFVAHDLQNGTMNWGKCSIPDVLIHLAWSGLPNYQDFFHITKNLPSDLRFLESAIQEGVPRLIVAGTCLEYGMQAGPLTEEMETYPITPYGLAKDSLRKSLEILQQSRQFALQWVRLFYMYGEGQNPNSLLSQLERALEEGRECFQMSAGDQLRDFFPVEMVARCIEWAVQHPRMDGVINCSSGVPISVLELVKRYLQARKKRIKLELGVFPYPDYEPRAFWGVPAKLRRYGFFDSYKDE